MKIPFRSAIFWLAGLVLLLGCGGDHPTTIPVSGKITFNQQPPPADGVLYFNPLSAPEGFPKRPVAVPFDRDGSFVARSWDDAPGLLPGTYQIAVECWKVRPEMGGSAGESHVPSEYQNGQTSGLRLELKPSDSARTVEFDIAT